MALKLSIFKVIELCEHIIGLTKDDKNCKIKLSNLESGQ